MSARQHEFNAMLSRLRDMLMSGEAKGILYAMTPQADDQLRYIHAANCTPALAHTLGEEMARATKECSVAATMAKNIVVGISGPPPKQQNAPTTEASQ